MNDYVYLGKKISGYVHYIQALSVALAVVVTVVNKESGILL